MAQASEEKAMDDKAMREAITGALGGWVYHLPHEFGGPVLDDGNIVCAVIVRVPVTAWEKYRAALDSANLLTGEKGTGDGR